MNNTTTFGVILNNAARLAGHFPNNTGINDDMKDLASMTLNSGLSYLSSLKFPILYVTEERVLNADAFISFNDDGDATRIDETSIIPQKFAYKEDPRRRPQAMPILGATVYDTGIQLPPPAPDVVYVRFIPQWDYIDLKTTEDCDKTIRQEFARYLAYLISIDLRTEDQGKIQSQQIADAEINKLMMRYGITPPEAMMKRK